MSEPNPPDSEAKNSSVASSSSASYFRQTAAKSVTRFSEMPSERHETVIQMGANIQLHSRSGFPEVDSSVLSDLVKQKDSDGLVRLEGVEGIKTSLKTDLQCGIRGGTEEISSRAKAFGPNTYVKPPTRSFSHFMWEASKNPTILILLGCAALSLGFGIKGHGLKEGWYDGGSIFFVVLFVILVSAMSNFRQNRQFDKLFEVSNNILVEVVRDGRRKQISIFEIVVGEVVCLKKGDQVPADGLFIDGYSLQVDESSMTGDSDHVQIDGNENPFLLSGTKVTDGYAKMLVTSVGMNTSWGEMMSTISRDFDEQTPLQARLNKLTSSIYMFGLIVAFIVLVVLLIRYFTGNTGDENGNREFNGSKTKATDVINAVVGIIIAAVTVVFVANPKGLTLAVKLTFGYSMKQMMANQAMVRKLSACETIGIATTICTEKTGILTSNQMKVKQFWRGNASMEGRHYNLIPRNVLDLLHQGVGLNTTGSVYNSSISGTSPEFSGSPTEKAILLWAVQELNMDMAAVKRDCNILRVEAFNSEKMRSGILMKKVGDDTCHVHWKGAPEIILAMCSHYYDLEGNRKAFNDEERTQFDQITQGMAASSLRCIAFAHKQVSEATLEENGLTLLGLVGLKDPCRRGVKRAVGECQYAGVNVKMITGDNVFTAKAIATECGILHPNQEVNDGSVVEGVEFRNYTEEERMRKADEIRVMARSSAYDKLLMVQCLKRKGHVVAVTGDGINDAPALLEADIGLAMGILGIEVAKESSDIVISDDNFASIARALGWGRCVYHNIQKVIQFKITLIFGALTISVVAAVATGKTPFTPAKFLWVSLVMGTLGALALATGKPSKELMHQQPVARGDPIISNVMVRNIAVQVLYQTIVILALIFAGKSIFGVHENEIDTLIFTNFLLLQVFNLFNARELEEWNVFRGILEDKLFLGITGITIVLQLIMVEFLSKFAHTKRLRWNQWGGSIGIGVFSWVIGGLFKFVPVPKRPILSYLFVQNGDTGESYSSNVKKDGIGRKPDSPNSDVPR